MELTEAQVRERWADISLYTESPMRARLSGLRVEYAILQVYSRDVGQRSATISFNVGQGTQDIGFRNDIDVLFTAVPSHPVRLKDVDERGQPATAAFLIETRCSGSTRTSRNGWRRISTSSRRCTAPTATRSICRTVRSN